MNEQSEQNLLDSTIISFCLKKACYDRVKSLLHKEMFDGEWAAIWGALVDAHIKFPDTDISTEELYMFFESIYPAQTPTASEKNMQYILSLDMDAGDNYDLQYDVIRKFWMRHRARQISELSVQIYLGKSNEFGELRHLIEATAEDSIGDKTSYTEIDAGLGELLDSLTVDPDFKFDWKPLSEKVKGLDRGHFGIIFARPETGKTTFVSFLAQKFLRQGLTVAVWGNEEPAIRTKLRIIQSYLEVTREELADGRIEYAKVYNEQIASRLHVLDCVGTTIQEIDDWCKIKQPDIVFIDQLDKVKISGKFNRGDEKLKEIYLQAREIAKRNKCLVWGVSQASAEAEGMANVEYQYLDNSKTGKAGEADLIIGIGKQDDEPARLGRRHICISKNKQNGWHGTIDVNMDMYRAVYQEVSRPVQVPFTAISEGDFER